jgi:exocyst complex component 5
MLTFGQTCDSVFKFLSSFHSHASLALDGTNLTVFLTEIGIGLRTQLLEHFKKFQVNATGALMVTKDMTKYLDLLRSWPLDTSFASSLEILAEIGNLFVIGPEALKERLRAGAGGGALAGVGKENLRPYVLRREDAGSVGIQSLLNSL